MKRGLLLLFLATAAFAGTIASGPIYPHKDAADQREFIEVYRQLESAQNKFVYPQVFTTTITATQAANGFTDSNLSGTVTPKTASDQVLINISQYVTINTAGAGTNICSLALYRNGVFVSSTPVLTQNGATPGLIEAMVPFNWVDAPASTTAVTYKTQLGSNGVPGQCMAQNNPPGRVSTSSMVLTPVRQPI